MRTLRVAVRPRIVPFGPLPVLRTVKPGISRFEEALKHMGGSWRRFCGEPSLTVLCTLPDIFEPATDPSLIECPLDDVVMPRAQNSLIVGDIVPQMRKYDVQMRSLIFSAVGLVSVGDAQTYGKLNGLGGHTWYM